MGWRMAVTVSESACDALCGKTVSAFAVAPTLIVGALRYWSLLARLHSLLAREFTRVADLAKAIKLVGDCKNRVTQ